MATNDTPNKGEMFHLLGFPELERTPHVLRCPLCKIFLSGMREQPDRKKLSIARDLVRKHVASRPGGYSPTACTQSLCFDHDVLSREVFQAMLRLGRPLRPLDLGAGTSLYRIPLGPAIDDQFWEYLTLQSLDPGEALVFLSRRARVHLRVDPNYVFPGEAAAIEQARGNGHDIREVYLKELEPISAWNVASVFHEKRLPKLSETILKEYSRLKELALMDVDFGR